MHKAEVSEGQCERPGAWASVTSPDSVSFFVNPELNSVTVHPPAWVLSGLGGGSGVTRPEAPIL